MLRNSIGISGRRVAILLLLGLVPPFCAKADIIPTARRINWAPGVRGGIPVRSTLINVRNAPYNAHGDGVTDDRAAIQSAINAAGANQVVYLPAGTYIISDGLNMTDKAISLRGAGPNVTIIKYTGSASSVDLIYGGSSSFPGGLTPITAGASKDSTTITVASASSVSAGSYILITQDNPSWVSIGTVNGPCTWCGDDHPTNVMSQLNKVVGKSGNVLTLERPLYFDYLNSPAYKRIVMLEGSGVEDLTVWRANSTAVDGHNFNFRFVENSWISNVTSTNAGNNHVKLYDAYACTIQGSYFHDAFSHGSAHGRGIWLFGWNSDNLVVNNAIYRCRHSVSFEGGGSGNVIAYNYAVAAMLEDLTFVTEDLDTHGAHPFMNLFEGNIFAKLSQDFTWGSSSHNTSFRSWYINYSSQNTLPTAGRWAVDLQSFNYSNNIVGCVIGRSGDTGVRYLASGDYHPASYRFGYPTSGSSTLSDTAVQPSTYVHGNYDFIGGGIVWDAGNSDHTLPASLYLNSKPSWFGNCPWPPFDPASPNASAVTNLPAGFRFLYGTNPPAGAQQATLLNLVRTNGAWRFTFSGTPATAYKIERAVVIRGPWTNPAAALTDGNGRGTWVDTSAPTNSAYYQALPP